MTELEFFSFFNDFDTASWLESARLSARQLTEWVEIKYREAPALTFGVAVALSLPAVATSGVLLRLLFARRGRHHALRDTPATVRTRPQSTWRQSAWLEFTQTNAARYRVRPGITRIGRETDNDLCISDPTVHRYHAVLEQTPDTEYLITYIGDPDRTGLLVDGQSVDQYRLRGGEILEIGSIRLRFAISAD